MSFDLNAGIGALLKFCFAFFFGVCILLWAFKPGNTWVYFILFAFLGAGLVWWVTKSRQLWLLTFLLILGFYLWKYHDVDSAIRWAGHQLPQKAITQGSKGAEKYFKSQEPVADVRKAVQASTTLDQDQINQCMRKVVTNYSKTDPNIARNAAVCNQKTGKEFQTCMETYAFNADANQQAVSDAAGCSGASENAGPSLAQKVANLGKGVAVTAACDVAELANYFPRVNFNTSKCPE